MTAVKCPHCDKEFGVEFSTSMMEGARTQVAITPNKGCKIDAGSIAGTINNFAKLLDGAAKAVGQPEFQHLVDRIDTDEEGKITITFLSMLKKRKSPVKSELLL